MKRLISGFALLFVLAGCSPTFPLVQDTRTPTPAPTMAPTAAPTTAPTVVCMIKGNVNRLGEKRYFLPSSINYKNVQAEAMFCTEAEAIANGYVKAGK